jgi:iron complex outermembrane receptor protein
MLRIITILFFVSIFSSHAQVQINGHVQDEYGQPIIGVNIIEKDTSNGTLTDFYGNYTLEVPKNSTLIFSYVGYASKEVLVDSQSEINVTLVEGEQLDEIVITGSRTDGRTSADSPVPVDVINVSGIASSTGKVEATDILQYAAPSFNATKQSGSDGADHIVPASLRGLGPDQTLVLINGKRRHQSSLVNVFGTRGRGNSGTDLNAIPTTAIKKIEVLRDGASAQYGSDAIAGIINIILNDNTDEFSFGVTYGAYSTAIGEGWEAKSGETLYNVEGKNRLDGNDKSMDGETLKIQSNYGVSLNDKGGFVNFTTELVSKNNTLRPGFSWRKGYGSAGVESFNFMINASLPINDRTEMYAFGGRSNRDTNAYAFSRSSLADGDNRSVPSLYPNGFTPRITSVIDDNSISAGIFHEYESGWKLDFSHSYGKNNFHYYTKDSNNASLQDASPTDFDAGGHFLSQHVTNLDLNKVFDDVASGLNLAFGIEYRKENFEIFAGEEASYGLYDAEGNLINNPAIQNVAVDANGDILDGGSQGFPGYSPDNKVNRYRNNFSVYADGEINLSENFLVATAFRFENYSDFGKTLNGKLAVRYKLSDHLNLRGSVSTGFRAPSLAQIYYNLVFNNIVAGASVPSLLSANNSTVTRAFGIGQLNEEKANNASVGITYKKNAFTATIDTYSISVDDRIILTDNFNDQNILGPLNVDAAQFFANGVDTKTSGVDIVLGYNFNVGDDLNINTTLVGNLNTLEIKNINHGDLNEFTFFGPFSQAYLEAASPNQKFGLNLNLKSKKFFANLSVTHFSKVILQDFQWVDSPATTEAEAQALYDVATDTYEAAQIVDISVGYKLNKNLQWLIGSNNLLNAYPTSQFDGWTDQGGLADSVQMGSDGRYIFSSLNFSF